MRMEFASFAKLALQQNVNSSLLLGDISVGLFIDKNDELPERIYNVGILEQSMISLAAGMSSRGFNVFVHTISSFIIERAYEQIKLDIGYNKNKVILVSANGPADYNKLGPTHHCFSDVPLLKLIPGINIFLPGIKSDVNIALFEAMHARGSSYVRLTSRDSKLNAVNNELNLVNKINSSTLNIFIGESLSFFEVNKENLGIQDWLYTYNIENINLDSLNKYTNLVFWEPYSSPVAGLYYRQLVDPAIHISSMVYPMVCEDGIFEHPGFSKIKI